MRRALPAGDAAVLLDLGNDAGVGVAASSVAGSAAGLAAAVRAAALPHVIDVVPGASTVLVCVEPGFWDVATLTGRLLAIPGPAGPQAQDAAETVIDVCYDGPDLAEIARLTGLAVAEVIKRHAAAQYRVGWLGFAPGFGYLTGLDPALQTVPRLDTPRLAVPAGAVAIAGGLAAVYPATSPGGWRLLGQTSARLWDQDREPPALLAPGGTVRFRPVDALPEAAGRPDPLAEPADPRRVPDRPGPVPAWAIAEVLQPGPYTTIQDLGRPGFGHLGVPRSGAADQSSLRRANALAGNDETAACLEMTFGRLALRFDEPAVVAICGAPVPVQLREAPDKTTDLPCEQPLSVPAGSVLRLGAPAMGLRSYLAVSGGVAAPVILGSRSSDQLSGLGPAPLQAGDLVAFGRPSTAPSAIPAIGRPRLPDGETELSAIAGPRADWFAPSALEVLATATYVVSADSNRSGVRLAGPPLRRATETELPSEGVTTGALQVSHDGQPILLLADHPTTGGYPVIAVLRAADIDVAAQLRPGQRVRFKLDR